MGSDKIKMIWCIYKHYENRKEKKIGYSGGEIQMQSNG